MKAEGFAASRPRARSVSPSLFWPFVLVCSTVAMTLVVIATRRGPGISVDSASYLSTARNLADGEGLFSLNGGLLTTFPPGFPVALATLVKVGVGPLDAARWVNALAFGATVVLSYLLLRQHVRSPLIIALSTGLIATAPALLSISSMAWSEPLFVVVTVALLLVLGKLFEAGTNGLANRLANRLPLVLVAVVLVWLGFMLRYAGLALVLVGAVVVLAAWFPSGARRAVGYGAAFAAISLAVPAVWMARNLVVGSGLLGHREPPPRGLLTNTNDAIKTASAFLASERVPSPVRVLGLVAVLALTGYVVWAVRGQRGANPTSPYALVPIVSFLVIYGGSVIVSASITSLDRLDNRLLAPLLVPLVVLVAFTADRLPGLVPIEHRRMADLAVAMVLTLWLLVSFARTVDLAAQRGRDGVGYAASRWQDSPLVTAITRTPQRRLLYSNDPYAVYSLTGREPVYASPSRGDVRSVEHAGDVSTLVQRACAGHVLLAWFARPDTTSDRLSLSELRRLVVLERIATTNDGLLFAVTPKRADQPPSRSCAAV